MNRQKLVLTFTGVYLFALLVFADEVFAPSHPEYTGVDPPLKQVAQGISPDQVICKEGLELIIKNNGSSACVRFETAVKLEQRGWGVMPPPCCKNMHQPSLDTDFPTKTSSSPDCSGNAKCFTGKVTRIIDGDTIKVDGQSIRFSLSSAPELNEFEGQEARNFIEEICPVGSTALVDEDDGQTEGSYGRIIGVIYCNGMNLNEELLDIGLGYLSSGFCNKSEFSSNEWAQKHGC